MRADNGAFQRTRSPILFAGVGALVLTAGFALLLAGVVVHAASKHSHAPLITVGAVLAVAGVVFGVVTLALFAFRGTARRMPPNDGWQGPTTPINPPGVPSNWRPATAPMPVPVPSGPMPSGPMAPRAARPQAPNGPGYVAPPAFGAGAGPGPGPGHPDYPDYGGRPGPVPGAPGPAPSGRPSPVPSGSGPIPSGSGPVPGGGPRPPWPQPFAASGPSASPAQPQRRAAPLDPTSVYSPGGLIGPPGSRDETPHVPGHEFESFQPPAPTPVNGDYAEVLHEARPEPSRPRPPHDLPLMPLAPPAVFVYRDANDPATPAGPGVPAGPSGFGAPVGPDGFGAPGGFGGPARAAPSPDASRGPFEPLTKSPDADGASD